MNHQWGRSKAWRGALTSIRGKITFLGTLGLLAVLAVSLIELFTIHRMLTRVEAEDTSHRVTRARRALERLKQSKANIITEFAMWDEAYDFASDPTARRFDH